jgi:putative ABC transport system substrate-binding protein
MSYIIKSRALRHAAIFMLLLAIPVPAGAQSTEKVFRLGYLGHTSPLRELDNVASRNPGAAALVDALRALGWSEGKNIQFVWRSAEGRFGRLPSLAEELVQARVDVIVASGVAADAAARATKVIPIVMASHHGPVPSLADSLARPGRNVTGLTQGVGTEVQKQLGLLKQASPRVSRVALVVQLQGARTNDLPKITEQPRFVDAAKALGLELFVVWFNEPGELRSAIQGAAQRGAHALLFDDIGVLTYPEHQRLIAEEAQRHRLLVMQYILSSVENGGLMAYGRDYVSTMRRAADFVDRVLKGAKPAELPIEQPSRIELHINVKAASAIGLEFPRSILLQADRVIH